MKPSCAMCGIRGHKNIIFYSLAYLSISASAIFSPCITEIIKEGCETAGNLETSVER